MSTIGTKPPINRQDCRNEMHLQAFMDVIDTIDEDEARIVAHKLVRSFPHLVCDEIQDYIVNMQTTIEQLNNVMKGLK